MTTRRTRVWGRVWGRVTRLPPPLSPSPLNMGTGRRRKPPTKAEKDLQKALDEQREINDRQGQQLARTYQELVS
jgi:hypothetical protein